MILFKDALGSTDQGLTTSAKVFKTLSDYGYYGTSLTIDEPYGGHGDGEEAVHPHVHLDQGGCEDEEEEDDHKAAGDAHRLRYPGEERTGLHQYMVIDNT